MPIPNYARIPSLQRQVRRPGGVRQRRMAEEQFYCTTQDLNTSRIPAECSNYLLSSIVSKIITGGLRSLVIAERRRCVIILLRIATGRIASLNERASFAADSRQARHFRHLGGAPG